MSEIHSSVFSDESLRITVYGDLPGHEFHGNQYSAIQMAPGTNRQNYSDREKRRGWNVNPSPMMVGGAGGGAMLARRLAGWSKEQHLSAAEHYKNEADRLSKVWSKTAEAAAQQTFGRSYRPTDYQISGIASEHFSDAHKAILRNAAQGASFAHGAADLHTHAARYAGRHLSAEDTLISDETQVIEFWETAFDQVGEFATKQMSRDEVASFCPDCAEAMADDSQDWTTDAEGQPLHVCGKQGAMTMVQMTNDENWVTINGTHVLLKPGETPQQGLLRVKGEGVAKADVSAVTVAKVTGQIDAAVKKFPSQRALVDHLLSQKPAQIRELRGLLEKHKDEYGKNAGKMLKAVIAADNDFASRGYSQTMNKTEGGEEFPKEAYAYVPDPQSPSTWKLRLWETVEDKVTPKQVGMAVAALGKGFRGNKVELPDADRAAVIAKVRAAWKSVHGEGDELPPVLKEHTQSDDVLCYSNAIRGIEIFKAGTHNGDEYTEKDLDDMVSAFKSLDFTPAIKVGHTKDKPGSPAYGWVRNLRRTGDKLYADFEDMHDSVVDALRRRAYDRVSSEIYFNLHRDGKTFPRALKAVALLGAEVPAVANLTPLHKMEFAESGFEGLSAFEQVLEVPTETLVESLAERVAGLVNLIKEYDMAKNAERIAALQAQVAEFKGKMDALKKKADDAEDEKDKGADEDMEKEMMSLSAQVAKFEAEIKALAEEDANAADLKKELAEAKAREEALSQRLAKLEQAERMTAVGQRVKACKIPAFQPGLQALYAYALDHAEAKVKVYSTKDGKEVAEEKDLGTIVDEFVGQINGQHEKLFKALAFSGTSLREDGTQEEDAGKEVQKKVEEYRAKHPEVKKYEVALKAVLAADHDLADRYRASQSTAQ